MSCQRCDPVGPGRVGADDTGSVVEAGPDRRVAVAEVGDDALQRVQRGRVAAGGGGMGAQRGERLGGQVRQPGAAVDQQGLGEDAGQPVAAILAGLAAVAPAVHHRGRLAHRLLDRLGAEDQLGQLQTVEVAQVLEVAELAEQIGQRDRERAHRRLGRQRLGGAERLAGRAADRRPVPGRPPPPGAARGRAALQDDGGRVRAGAPVAHVVAVMERGSGRVQRLDQTRQCPSSARRCGVGRPGRGCAAAAVGLSASQRRGLLREQRGASVELARSERPGASPRARHRRERRRRDGAQRSAGGSRRGPRRSR